MKKIAIFALAFTAMNSFAWEWNVKAGFDAWRSNTGFTYDESTKKLAAVKPSLDNTEGMGFTLGTEVIPVDTGIFELGVGAEYNFGVKTVQFNTERPVEFGGDKTKVNNKKEFIPIYAVSHINMYRTKDSKGSVYLVNRLGGVATRVDQTKPFAAGVYYGAGLGFEYGPLVAEVLYDGAFVPAYSNAAIAILNESKGANTTVKEKIATDLHTRFTTRKLGAPDEKAFENKVGIKLGLRLGDYTRKAPVVKKEVVKKEVVKPVVVVPVVKPEPKPMPKPVPKPMPKPEPVKPVIVEVKKTKTSFIHANCNAETKICTIYGFKVDGRKPNAEEQRNIAQIADMVNKFAISGDIDVVGHTDATGSVKYNQKLSVERAQEVTKLLKAAGLKEEIKVRSISGKGELDPETTNRTKAGRYKNRRVQLIFKDLNR
ncbi:MAG: OmpA family protein [Oceanivirga sp.]|nr:OmpA family protein [Oceanivirga sp.]